MDYEHLIYEKTGHRATLILNRPEKINALNEKLTREFEAAMLAAEDDNTIRVVVLKGDDGDQFRNESRRSLQQYP